MKIDLHNLERNGFVHSHRLPGHYVRSYKLLALPDENNPKVREIIDVRFYATEKLSTCVVWINYRDLEATGSATDNGIGYNRNIVTFKKALKAAGVKITGNYEGSNREVEQTMMAIGNAMTNRELYIVRAFG